MNTIKIRTQTNNKEENTMTNEIMAFNYNETQVRTIEIGGEPWFVLMDVCDILELSEPHRVATRLDDDERTKSTVIDSLGRKQEMTIISESGLYSVILRSDKPEAKPFRKWVTSEVLPSIRKTGKYSIRPNDNSVYTESQMRILDDISKLREREDKLIEENVKICTLNSKLWDNFRMKEEKIKAYYEKNNKLIEKIKKLEQRIEELDEQRKKAEIQAEQESRIRTNAEIRVTDLEFSLYHLCPDTVNISSDFTTAIMKNRYNGVKQGQYKIDYYDAVVNSEGLYTIEETAKLCSSDKFVIGRNQLYDWLMNNGYISAQNKLPYQKYIENGVFRVCLCNKENEETDNCIGVFVTSDGLKYLYAELSKSANEFKIK